MDFFDFLLNYQIMTTMYCNSYLSISYIKKQYNQRLENVTSQSIILYLILLVEKRSNWAGKRVTEV